MTRYSSLLAQKLRAWRTANGTHGRMTQEILAEVLGVSIDAIGKYERSVSFIRGDLEYRLVEKLGWTREEIQACREDWEIHQRHPVQSLYRLLDDTVVDELYDGSWRKAYQAVIAMAETALGDLPDELAANTDVFLPIYDAFRVHTGAVLCGDQMVATWSMPFLFPEGEALFRACRLNESELTVDRIRQPILPGTYFGYCPGLIVSTGHEAASSLLLSSFVRFLEDLATRDVLLHSMGAIAVSTGGAQVCRDLGMTWLGNYCINHDFGVWELPGAAVPDTIFARRSPLLRQSYTKAFRD